MTDNVQVDHRGEIVLMTVNRPAVLNALNAETVSQLSDAFASLKVDPRVRVIILTGAGRKAFVAGADIAEMQGLNAAQATSFSRSCQALGLMMEELDKPIIAAVNGYALGGGCELMMACDFALASTRATFGQPEVNLGLIPGFGGTQRLARLVGRGLARQLVYTGEMVNAERALSIGLVNELVEPDALVDRAFELAGHIVKSAPLAVSACKKALNRGIELPLEAALDFEAVLFGAMFNTSDMREGTAAFVDKRPAHFEGR